ncbi:hypothetical protein AB0J52_00645 [Spirillospora sp. NPDC049652]
MGESSYTTITMKPGKAPDIGITLYGGETLTVLDCTSRAAQVSLSMESAHVTICPPSQEAVTDADVATARELAEAFTAYAAKVEQLHAQHTADRSGADGSERAA